MVNFIFLIFTFLCIYSSKNNKNNFYKIPYELRLPKKHIKIGFNFYGKEGQFIIKTGSKKNFRNESEKFKISSTKRFRKNN